MQTDRRKDTQTDKTCSVTISHMAKQIGQYKKQTNTTTVITKNTVCIN